MKTKPRTRGNKGPTDDVLAHLHKKDDPYLAWCGKKLRGVKAPKEVPLCVVCKDLWRVS